MTRWSALLVRRLRPFVRSLLTDPPKTGIYATSPNWEACTTMDQYGLCSSGVPMSKHRVDETGYWYHPSPDEVKV